MIEWERTKKEGEKRERDRLCEREREREGERFDCPSSQQLWTGNINIYPYMYI